LGESTRERCSSGSKDGGRIDRKNNAESQYLDPISKGWGRVGEIKVKGGGGRKHEGTASRGLFIIGRGARVKHREPNWKLERFSSAQEPFRDMGNRRDTGGDHQSVSPNEKDSEGLK